MEIQNVVVIVLIGILFGSMGTWIFKKQTESMLREQIHNRDMELTESSMLETEMETRLRDQQKTFEEKVALLNESKDLMKLEFESLASKIMEEKARSFTIQNKENISSILNPLREQIGEFKKRVEDVYDKESQGRASLFNEITNLKSLNLKISEDAINLTRALKGDSKTQGDWGQVVLERVLEMSGLEKGREYEIQVHTHNLEGDWFFPDAIVRLPENRDVIVDSKVSLTAYEQYCSAESDEERVLALKNHLLSVHKHIKELSEKRYEKLIEVSSIDFVVIFIPIESAYIAAIKEEPTLFEEGIKANIILTCPNTLLSVLKVISYTWRLEKQQRNSQEIAEKAGSLYDKFCAFVNVFQDVGEGLKNAQNNFDQAAKYLSTGRGNLIKRSEELKKLGVSGKKELPQKLLEQCDCDSSENDVPTPNQANGDLNGETK